MNTRMFSDIRIGDVVYSVIVDDNWDIRQIQHNGNWLLWGWKFGDKFLMGLLKLYVLNRRREQIENGGHCWINNDNVYISPSGLHSS